MRRKGCACTPHAHENGGGGLTSVPAPTARELPGASPPVGAGVPLHVGAAAPPPPPRGACLFISKIVVVRLRRRALGEGTCLKAQGRAGAFGVRRMGIHIPWASVVDEVMGTRNMVGAAHGIRAEYGDARPEYRPGPELGALSLAPRNKDPFANLLCSSCALLSKRSMRQFHIPP